MTLNLSFRLSITSSTYALAYKQAMDELIRVYGPDLASGFTNIGCSGETEMINTNSSHGQSSVPGATTWDFDFRYAG